MNAAESVIPSDRRIRRAVTLFRELIAYHPGLFFTSMAGATVYALCTVASSWALQWVIDRVVLPRFEEGSVPTRTLLLGLLLLVALAIVRASGVILRRTWAGKAQWHTAESITGEVVDSLVAQPVSWHRRQSPGDLVARAGVDVEATVAVMAPLPYASSVVLMMVVAGIGLILNDAVLGLLAIAVFPVLIAANVMYQRRVDRWYDLAQQELGSLSAAAHESFEGVSVVKAFGAENRETERLASIAARVQAARVEAIGLRSSFESVLDVVPSLANVGIVALGAHRVNAGELSIGGLASFIYLFTLLVFPLRILGYALSELPRSLAGRSRIRSLTDQVVESDPRRAFDARSVGSTEVTIANAVLRADNVTVAHGEGSPVVTGVSLRIEAGTLTVFVGATGSGKTTLLEALAGLIPTSSGSIRARSTSMALVFQEPFLLGASVLDNVTMGRAASQADITWALMVADAEFVEDLPHGLATVVGERGVGLSGGQRQRLALARAVLARPAVLFLDDTTSALDPRTEAQVLANLRSALPDTAIVAVASRPSLIRMSDRVLFLESGQVLAEGPHDQLLLTCAPFAALMDAYDEDRDCRE
ncbi:MAG: ABC transporter ATP-binding protein [Ilumatobacteraceae bacterium]